MKNSSLSSSDVTINVALLDTFKSKGGFDYVDCFLPILAHVLNKVSDDKIEVHKIRDLIKEELGIQFPEASIAAILKRASKKDLLSKREGFYFKNPKSIQELDNQFLETRKEISHAQEELFLNFATFAKKEFEKVFSSEEFYEKFFNFLKNNFLEIMGRSYEPNIQGKSSSNDNYLISSFLKSVWSKESGFPVFVERNIQGFLLSNYLSTSSLGVNEKIKNFKIYVDTPIVIAALGYNGKSKEIYTKELIQSLIDSGAEVFILDINEEELRWILKGWIQDLKFKNYHNFKTHTLLLLRNRGYDEVALERHVTLLESNLKALGLKVIDKPEYVPKIQIDEEALKKVLVKEGFDEDKKATDRDVDCISAINRFRNGQKTYPSSDKIHVFFTKNPALQRISNDFFYEEDLASEDSLPPVMGEGILASLLLANHSGKFTELGKKMLLNQAYSFIYTDDYFLEKYSKRLDSLLKENQISEEDYSYFRYDHEIRSYIKHYKVQNDLEDCDEKDFLDILEVLKKKQKQSDEQVKLHKEAELKSTKDALKREEDRSRNLGMAHEAVKKEKQVLAEERRVLLDENKNLKKVVFVMTLLASIIISALICWMGLFLVDIVSVDKKIYAQILNFVVSFVVFIYGVSTQTLQNLMLRILKVNV